MGIKHINSLNKQYIKEKINEKKSKENSLILEEKMINETIKMFQTEESRGEFLNKIKKWHFSETKVNEIEKMFSNFNQDNITYNDVNNLIEASAYLKQQNKESFFSTIANIVIPNNKEEDDDN